MIIVGEDLRVRAYNAMAYKLFGMPETTYYEGRYFPDILNEWADQTEQTQQMREKALSDIHIRETYEIEFPQIVDNGIRWCLLAHIPLEDGGFIRSFTDITERKQMEEKDRQQQEQLLIQ